MTFSHSTPLKVSSDLNKVTFFQPESKQTAANPLLEGLHLLAKFPPELFWMFFVDGKFFKSENGPNGVETREKGYVCAVMQGLRYAISQIEKPHTNELFKIINGAVLKTSLHSEDAGKFRTANTEIWALGSWASKAGFESLMSVKNPVPVMIADADSVFMDGRWKAVPILVKDNTLLSHSPQTITAKILKTFKKKAGDPTKAFCYIPPAVASQNDPNYLVNFNNKAITRYPDKIVKQKTFDAQIEAIAEYLQELCRIHAFKDGNNRTYINCMLTTELLKIGSLPSIMFEPNIFEFQTISEIAAKIKEGIEVAKKIMETPSAVVYEFSHKDLILSEELKKDYAVAVEKLLEMINKKILSFSKSDAIDVKNSENINTM